MAESVGLTIKEFCAFYKMSRRTFYRRVKRGQCPAGIRIGRSIIIEHAAIKEWLETVRGVSNGYSESGPI